MIAVLLLLAVAWVCWTAGEIYDNRRSEQ